MKIRNEVTSYIDAANSKEPVLMFRNALLLNCEVFWVIFSKVYNALETEVSPASEVSAWIQALKPDVSPPV